MNNPFRDASTEVRKNVRLRHVLLWLFITQHPLSAKWTGSGENYGFMNQPNAGYANFAILVESLLPIIDANGGDSEEVRDEMLKRASFPTKMSLDVEKGRD